MTEVRVTSEQLANGPDGATALAQYTKQLMAAGGIPVVVDQAPGFSFTKPGNLHAIAAHDEITYCWEAGHA